MATRGTLRGEIQPNLSRKIYSIRRLMQMPVKNAKKSKAVSIMNISIAIDGPSGAGKSTMAKRLAKKLGYIYVDTGAMYRAVGLFVARAGANPKLAAEVSPLLGDIEIELKFLSGAQHIFLCGEDVSDLIRTPQASIYASDVSALPCVRAFLLDMQRGIAERNSVVMDGRDIGTVVLPHAQVKIFLTAEPEVRAKRRFDELRSMGVSVVLDEVLRDMIYRDKNDSGRACAPLIPASDSVRIDTSGLTLEQSIELLERTIEEKIHAV